MAEDGERMMERTSTPDALPVPRAPDLPDPGRRFSVEGMSRRLKVLFIVSQPTPSPAISVHANLMRFLDRDRVEVHVLYNRLAAGEPYQSAGTSVLEVLPQTPDIRLRPAEFGPVGGAPKQELLASTARAFVPAVRDSASLVRYIQRNRIDVIHCEEGSRNAFYAFALSRITRAKCVVHFHLKYGSWMTPLSRLAVRRADAIIVVSSWTGRVIYQAGVSPERIFPVLNGIDVADWDPAEVDGAAIRREFEVQPGDPLVVMVAQLTAWKRQATLIEAFRSVAEKHPNARLLIVGVEWNPASAPGQVSYTEELRRLVADAGLDRHVVFTGQRRDVRQILAAADIFALPSVGEPFGLAQVEAMAMAKPIVAVRAGGSPEVVEHGKTGLLGLPDDSEQLASNIIALIDDPARRHEMGEYGRRHVREHLNAKRMADDVEGVYREVLGVDTVEVAGAQPQASRP